MGANIHSKPLYHACGAYVPIPPKRPEKIHANKGNLQKLGFVQVGACTDVISCHSDAQHKAIIPGTEASFVFNLSTLFIWAVY